MSGRRGPGLLLQPKRSRQSGGDSLGSRSGARRSSPGAPSLLPELDELPPYEPLELPLDEGAVQKISEIFNSGAMLRNYDAHLKKAAELLRETVGNVNDAYSGRAAELQDVVERRRERGRNMPTRSEPELEKTVAMLADAVPLATRDVERQARRTIDLQMELEDERDALTATSATLLQGQLDRHARRRQDEEQGRRERRAAAAALAAETAAKDGGDEETQNSKKNGEDGDNGSDDEEQAENEKTPPSPPPASVVALLRDARATKAADYAQMTAYQKYGLNNDYITFKQTWHDAVYPDGEVVLPDASAWFDAAGEPAPYGPNSVGAAGGGGGGGSGGGEGGGGDGGGEDDELIVAREVVSFKCPLTLLTMKDPYRGRECRHTFEKSAIMEYLQQGPKTCPQTGCERVLKKSELVPNKRMLHQIERAERLAQRRNEAAATSDIEADDVDVDADVDVGMDASVDGNKQTKAADGLSEAETQARSVKRERFSRTR
ncbi:chromosomal organization and DNA repair protein [Niveomyces insectorum RCEF 264]|uniref:peptidylprolyl isomerase n=1 Tax=Niveomyces insectorum RCEF 264 TaxID=1081102 RepID=A0A167TY58_9HYPO|nr:chromosomal organization and DNA repair protein [Niveomyces insectorum RCEF 264]